MNHEPLPMSRTVLFLLLLVDFLLPTCGFHQTLAQLPQKQFHPGYYYNENDVSLKSSVAWVLDDDVASMGPYSLVFEQEKREIEIPIDLLQRCALVGLSCVTTWFLTKCAGLSVIQATTLRSIVATVTLPAPYAAASDCGSLAGLSAQLSTIDEASLLGIICASNFYWWEAAKIQTNKVGRLGAIAFLANVIFLVLQQGSSGMEKILMNILEVLRPSTTAVVLACSLGLAMLRNNENSVQESNAVAPRPSRICIKCLLRLVLVGSLASRLLLSSTVPTMIIAKKWAASILTAMATSMIMKNTQRLTCMLFITAVNAIVGSMIPGPWRAPIYVGCFFGMSAWKNLDNLQSSLLSVLLSDLGLFTGFGGRMGFLAFVSVAIGR